MIMTTQISAKERLQMQRDKSKARLRKMRRELGVRHRGRAYSQAEIAEMLGVHRSTVYKYENDFSEFPVMQQMGLAYLYEVSVEYLRGMGADIV